MDLRQALIQQSPSLALQRAAADEIAKLDARIHQLENTLIIMRHGDDAYSIPAKYHNWFMQDVRRNHTGELTAEGFNNIWGDLRV